LTFAAEAAMRQRTRGFGPAQPLLTAGILHPLLLHMHVPRSSGSSLHAWFVAALGAASVAQASSPDEVAAVTSGGAAPAVVSGHYLHGVHVRRASRDYRYVVLLRDPVERVLSLFRYIRGLPGHSRHADLVRPGMTIPRYYAEGIPGSWARNGMVGQLAGSYSALPPEERLACATEHLLDERTIFGLVEDPQPLLCGAARILDLAEVPPLARVNRSARVEPGQAFGGDDADLAAIVEHNALDIELYRRAQAHLARRDQAAVLSPAPGLAERVLRRTFGWLR
jgi:hypothetical protein